MLHSDNVSNSVGVQCGMRRPTFAFNAVQSPRRSGKTRRFNVGNHDGAIISDSSGKQCSSSSEGTSSNYETKGNLIGECNSSPTLGSLSTSTPQKPEGDIHNAKNQFRRAANVCGNDVQLVSTPLPYSTTGDCQKPRKRKERLDSSSSITQERKLVRSNSEERPPEEKSEIRRVVSHEDFLPLHVHNARLASQYAHNDNIHKVS
ncbi:uncharacterized protein LOC113367202 [Ctenocephalides felis]|uniref:uncharacterized protein LOC113367202 n=1 Tax=Ctenocephalides felis TaxID=7515 RepID=UPI000E6E18AA|nr:uncharacterized protein LOC113367202 [Ctenocephalides felis]